MSPVPMQRQVFNAFRGTHEDIHSALISEVYSSTGSQNVYLDKHSRVRKIGGYAKLTSSTITTDTGADACRCVGLFPHETTSGVTKTQHIIGVFEDQSDEWEIWVSTDTAATFTFKEDITGSVNRVPDFAMFDAKTYIATGTTAPRTWDGSTLATAGGTQSPTPTAAANGAGVLSGTYEYILLSMVGKTRQYGSAISTVLQVTDKQIQVTWTADTNVNVTGYELYRTTGTGVEFRFLDYIDGRLTASYDDNTSDADILGNFFMEDHGEAPPSCHFVEPHRQRMWYGRTDSAPRTIYYSDPGNPDSCYTANNKIDLTDSSSFGDVLRGMKSYSGYLVGFLEHSVWMISGTGALVGGIPDWDVRRTSAQTGCVANQSVVEVPANAMFVDHFGETRNLGRSALAYFTPLGDIRLFDGDSDTVISSAVTTTLSTHNPTYAQRVFAVHDNERQHVTWYFTDGSDLVTSKGVRWDYGHGVWSVVTPVTFGCGTAINTGSDESVILLGEGDSSVGGEVYQDWSGNSFNGSNIESIWYTKPLYGHEGQDGIPAIYKTKRFRELDVLLSNAASTVITVSWHDGRGDATTAAIGSTTVDASNPVVISASGSTIITNDSNQIIVSGGMVQSRLLLKTTGSDYAKTEALQLKFADDSTGNPWGIEAFTLRYQLIPEVRKYQD